MSGGLNLNRRDRARHNLRFRLVRQSVQEFAASLSGGLMASGSPRTDRTHCAAPQWSLFMAARFTLSLPRSSRGRVGWGPHQQALRVGKDPTPPSPKTGREKRAELPIAAIRDP